MFYRPVSLIAVTASLLCAHAPAAYAATAQWTSVELTRQTIDDETMGIEAPEVQRLLRRAYELEHASATTITYARPSQLYCLAARLGSVEALYRLAKLSLDGRESHKDPKVAASVFSLAAINGHEGARSALENIPLGPENLPRCLREKP